MALMYPEYDLPEKRISSRTERALYPLFRDHLSPEYRVLHSVKWHIKTKKQRIVDGEADFIFIHPRYGVIVLEAKGGTMAHDAETHVWTSVDRNGKTHIIADPFDQAKRGKHALVEHIQLAPNTKPFAEEYPITYGVWFPDMDWPRDTYQIGYPQSIILDRSNLDDLNAGLRQIFGVELERPISTEAIEALLTLLIPTAQVRSSLARQFVYEGRHIERLTEMQRERLFAMWQQRQIAIAGAAGTGKTILAYEAAWRLAQEGRDVLLLSNTQFQADWLTAMYVADEVADKPRLTIYGLNSLSVAMAKRAGTDGSALQHLRVVLAHDQQVMAQALFNNIRRLDVAESGEPYHDWRFDAIVVDEAQDIEQSLWVPLRKLLRDEAHGIFYLFYDEAQRLDLPGNWSPALSGVRTILPLIDNCRNTGTILSAMIALKPELAKTFQGPPGRAIQFIDPQSFAQEGEDANIDALTPRALLAALDEITGEAGEVRPEDILVITCRSTQNSQWRDWKQLGNHTLRQITLSPQPDKINLSTIRTAKGLESNVVILVELDGLRSEAAATRNTLLYVAISRARHHLIVLGTPKDIVPA